MYSVSWTRMTRVTYECWAESVEEGLSLSSGMLSSNTIVSVFARQNPLDLMISVETSSEWSEIKQTESSSHRFCIHIDLLIIVQILYNIYRERDKESKRERVFTVLHIIFII